MMELKSFSNYEFTVEYPARWKVKVYSRSIRERGTLSFRPIKGTEIFISWGPLKEARERYSSSKEHADDALDRLRKARRVKKVELVESKSMRVNSHRAQFNHVKITEVPLIPFLKRVLHHEIRSLHVHCARSGRYFVIYGMTTPEESERYRGVFGSILKSFKCHGL